MALAQPPSGIFSRAWIVWVAVVAVLVLLVLFKDRVEPASEQLSQYQFEQLLNSNLIASATITYDNQSPLNDILGRYFKVDNSRKTEIPFHAKVRLTPELEQKLLSSPQFEARQPNALLFNIVSGLLPFIVIALLIWFFFIRQIRKVSSSSANQQAKATEQQARFDKILDKWEEQARRMDSVLDKMNQHADK